jgi:hypothetical protein
LAGDQIRGQRVGVIHMADGYSIFFWGIKTPLAESSKK